MAEIKHRLGIKAPAAKVYEALTTVKGLAGWWTTKTSGDAHPGGRLNFQFLNPEGKIMGGFLMEVMSHEQDKNVLWKVLEGPQDWIGSEISFSLSTVDGQTIVIFNHRKWPEANEHLAHCSMKWAVFLLSLKDLVETGKGKPSPMDFKIDNWN